MTEPERPKRDTGSLFAAGAVLGTGIGAAVGAIMDNLSTGIWIGGVIGIGLAMLASFFLGD